MNMKKRLMIMMMSSLLMALSWGTAFADESIFSDKNFSATLSFTTDYVFRGVSYSNEDPAIQGSFDYAHPSGLYLGVWGSNWDGGDSHVEIDPYVGFAGELFEGLGYDLCVFYYNYPGADDDDAEWNYFEGHVGLSYTFADMPLTPTVGVGFDYSPDYSAEDGKALYGSGSLDVVLPAEIGLSLECGHQNVEGDKSTSGFNWTHWRIGISKEIKGFGFDVSYHDTNRGGNGELWGDIGDSRVVFTVSRTF